MNNINLTRDELNKLVKENNLEVYPQEQFNAYIEGNKELLIKGETSDLDDIEKSEYNVLQEEIKSFKKVEVYNIAENSKSIIEKSICYVRPKQVEWTEEDVLVKSEDGTEQIEKSKSGIYTNTKLNQKLGRVGQKYGQKSNDNDNKDSKEFKKLMEDIKNYDNSPKRERFIDSLTNYDRHNLEVALATRKLRPSKWEQEMREALN